MPYSKMMLIKAVHYYWEIDYKNCNYKTMSKSYTIQELENVVRDEKIDVGSVLKTLKKIKRKDR